MKKLFALIGMAFLFTQSFAQLTHHSYEVSVFKGMNKKNAAANAAALNENVKRSFPQWNASVDPLNGTFTDIYGPAIQLDGATTADKVNNCIQNQLKGLSVDKTQWKQVSASKIATASYVNFVQYFSGHKVVFSKLAFRFTAAGDLLRVQMKNFGKPKSGLTPVTNADDAKKAASADLKDVTISAITVDKNWVWFPIPGGKAYELHPSWAFSINGKSADGMVLKLSGYVDAITGKLVYRTSDIKETFDVKVKGTVYKNGFYQPTSAEPLAHLQLTQGSNTYYTDTAGFYSNTGLNLPLTAGVALQGLWSTVVDAPTSQTPTFNDLVTVLGSIFSYPVSSPSSDRHVNAYYHVNRVHDFMKGYFPSFTGMDISLPTNVDITSGTCNAYYDGSAINFFAAGGGCISFSYLGDVIYHEYGHGITDKLYTQFTSSTIQNGALNEALSDVWALSITHDPVLAKGAFTTVGGFIRRYDLVPKVYPRDLLGEPHADGEIIAGTWIDVANNLNSYDTMTNLFTLTYYDTPDGPNGTEGEVYHSVLVSALLHDDNDNNLSNGTPHYRQIISAFAKHGIYLEGETSMTHTELTHQAQNAVIPVTASLTLEYATHLKDLILFYKARTASSWDSVIMTNVGSLTFNGQIPAQTAGTVLDYYFAIYDSLNVPNAFFPYLYNPQLPSYYTSIPYQFAVGITNVISENFEIAPATGWSIGSNPGDDATGGIWTQIIPADFNDHTFNNGTGKCLVTGTSFQSDPVSHGTTTVLSPVFDLTAYNKPVVEYYRINTNEFSLQNAKNDPWQVFVRDTIGSSWLTVERTYQDDTNWRRRVFAVSEYLPPIKKHLQLRFMASDSVLTDWEAQGQSQSIGGVDDFSIYESDSIIVGVPSLVMQKAKVFPNPADDQLYITLPQSAVQGAISLYNVTGALLLTKNTEPGQAQYVLDTKALAPGFYTLVIQRGKNIEALKVLVRHN